MCGFAGIARGAPKGVDREILARMGGAIRHRGPDGFGYVRTPWLGAVHVRLSIIDVESGAQPLTNEDGNVLVVFNGEIYNFVELREELRARGHVFRTRTDTEVLVHGYEEWGEGLLERLNGEFAFAIHDVERRSLLLARDRFGIRPLFYALRGGDLHFASEAKALFAGGEVPAAPSLEGVDEVFTFWGARPPNTAFRGVQAIEPGCYATWSDGRLDLRRYYRLGFPEMDREPADAVDRVGAAMHDGVRLRMRSDVTVGGYLSGGLDSSITCAMATRFSERPLETFSIGFADPAFDEGSYQDQVARQVGSVHHRRAVSNEDIAEAFPRVIEHTETPVVRTAPVPLFLLSRLTRENGIKVVLTGEGADEVFLGYELFKEARIRLFCLRQPESRRRPRLFERIYRDVDAGSGRGDFWQRFFLEAGGPEDPLFSHLPRFLSTSWIKEFYSADARAALTDSDPEARLRASLPTDFEGWSPLNRAAYLEFDTLLSSYLLCSQGDRMAMAHGVEGRVPFLDHRLFELAARLPVSSKLRVLREKDILRRWARAVVPPDVEARPKQAYRAPDTAPFSGDRPPEYVDELLSEEALRNAGIFEPAAVAGLLHRVRSGRAGGFRESQAFVGILSTQLWHEHFFLQRPSTNALDLDAADVALEYDADRVLTPELRPVD